MTRTPLGRLPARIALARTGYYLLAVVDRFLAGMLELEDRWLTRLCFVASLFEDVYRTGEIVQTSMLQAASQARTSERWPRRSQQRSS